MPPGHWHEIAAGLQYVRGRPSLTVLVLMSLAMSLTASAMGQTTQVTDAHFPLFPVKPTSQQADPAGDAEGSGGPTLTVKKNDSLCLEAGDNGSRELIEDNLEDEEEHLDWLEAQLDQIEQMGLQNYLLGQL